MNLKRNICLLTGILMIFSLTACTPEEPNEEVAKATPDISFTDAEQKTADKSSIEALLLNTPGHISKVFSQNFSVEADVHVPKVKKADVLFARYMPFDEQKLLSLFYKGKTPQRSLNEIDDTISYTDSNSYLNISEGFVTYGTEDYQYVKFPTDSFVPVSDISSSARRFGDVYTLENLEFMSRSEAFKAVSDVLKELSVDIAEDAEVYAIDSSTMQKEQENEIQRQIDNQKKASISSGLSPTEGYKVKDRFTKEDDFYIFFFKTKQNEIPVTQSSYIIQASERLLNGSTARVSFSQKGIIELSLRGIYQQQGVAEAPKTIISVEEALQKAFERQNAIISTDKVTVTAIDFEYVPVPYNNNYNEVKLTPAWSLTLTYERIVDKPSNDGKQNSKLSVSHRRIFINAVTGEEIK